MSAVNTKGAVIIGDSTVTRKYPRVPAAHVLSRCANAHNCLGPNLERWWNSDHVVLKLSIRTSASPRREQSDLHLKLWPCGFKIDYTHLGFPSAAAIPLGSDGDPGCIFFILNTCKATFITDILWNNCRKSKKMEVWHTDGRTDGRKDRQTWSLK